MKTNFKTLFFYFLSCFLFSFFYSCNEEQSIIDSSDDESSSVETDRITIERLGFDITNLIDMGTYYIVEGDIVLLKSSLVEDNEFQLKQARVESLISYLNQRPITVGVDGSLSVAGDDYWADAIYNAVSEWNRIEGSNLRFVVTTSSDPDILIRAGSLPNNVLALASWPENGKPGPSIQVNLNFDWNAVMTNSQKLFTMVHEIGHCLGLRHTNWSGCGEVSGIGISGTPNSGSNPDPKSVMNGLNPYASWNGFSQYDKIAITTLYPMKWDIRGFPSSLSTSDLNKNLTLSLSRYDGMCSQTGMKYKWSITGGNLVSGQETSTVTAYPYSPYTFGVNLEITDVCGVTYFISQMVGTHLNFEVR